MNAPQYLIQDEINLSAKAAEKIVDKLLSYHNISFKSKGKHNEIIFINRGETNEKTFKYHELIAITRKEGVCTLLQSYFDNTDIVFGGAFGMSASGGLELTSTWGGYSKKLKAPFTHNPSEIELYKDIEFYKSETCIESNNYIFELCFRNYRAFLFSCIALVDAYINRHIALSKFQGLSSKKFNDLVLCRNTDERINLFLKTYANKDVKSINQTEEWRKFQELKTLRNEITHSINPYLGVSIRELPRNLNYSNAGIGGLLKLLQEAQGRKTLTFIEKVRNSPLIHFNEVIQESDGMYKVKKIFSK